MVKYEEYEKTLSRLQNNLDDPDSVLSFVDTLSKFIKVILNTQLYKYSFIKGLDFNEISSQLALDYFLKVKSGKLKVRKWGLFLRKDLLGQIKANYSDPRSVSLDPSIKVTYEVEEEDWGYDLDQVKEMIKLLFPHLTLPELKILMVLAIEFKLNFYDKVRGLKPKKKYQLIKIVFRYLNYLFRREYNMKVKTEGETLLRVLSGIAISPLFLVLDLEQSAKVIATLGGQTIRIPTFSELKKVIPLLVIFYEYNIKGKSIKELSEKFNVEKEDLKLMLQVLSKVKLSEYEKKNLIIALTKIVELSKAQDSFISQRLIEIEEKLRKNSRTTLELYKTLAREETKGIEDILKLTSEIVKHIT